MPNARRDENFVPVIQGLSNADGITPLSPFVDSVTNRLLVSVMGSVTTDVDVSSLATETTLNKLVGLIDFNFDTIEGAYPDTVTEVYTYKLSGVTKATITIIYTDATKETFTSVVRS